MNIEEYKKRMAWREFKAPSGFVFHIRKLSALLLARILKSLNDVSPEDLQAGRVSFSNFEGMFGPVLKECVKEIKDGLIKLDELDPNDGLMLFDEIFRISNMNEAAQVKKFRGEHGGSKKHK